MFTIIEVLKSILLGIVEGITEWLPISSTGHMILLNEVVKLDESEEFISMYMVLIQLGAIFAVICLFWPKIWLFKKDEDKLTLKKETLNLWLKIIISTIPVTIIGLLLDEYIENNLQKPIIIASTLIFYGILFIVVEKFKKHNTKEITFKMAVFIGLVQTLALIPGTSRSGVTIIFAMLYGVNRYSASEYTFLLAIPTMIGASLVKIVKFGFVFSNQELCILLIGSITSFLVSLLVIKGLMNFVKKRSFKVFGWYRIILGLIIVFLLI